MSNWWIKMLIGAKLICSIWYNYCWINYVHLGALRLKFRALGVIQWQKNELCILPRGDEQPVSMLCETDARQQDNKHIIMVTRWVMREGKEWREVRQPNDVRHGLEVDRQGITGPILGCWFIFLCCFWIW